MMVKVRRKRCHEKHNNETARKAAVDSLQADSALVGTEDGITLRSVFNYQNTFSHSPSRMV